MGKKTVDDLDLPTTQDAFLSQIEGSIRGIPGTSKPCTLWWLESWVGYTPFLT